MNEHDDWARLLPPPPTGDLPEGRHQQLKEFVMTETSRRTLSRPILLATALGGAAALAVGLPVLLGGPAHAITDNPDGTLTVTIHQAGDPKALQADLRARGFNVVVDYVPADKSCSPQPRSTTWVPGVRFAHPLPEEAEGPGFLLDPSVVEPGQTAVLEVLVGTEGQDSAGVSDLVSAGPVAECTLVDRPGGPRDPQ